MSTPLDLDAVAEAIRRASGLSVRPDQYDALHAAIVRAFPGREPEDLVATLSIRNDLLDCLVDEVAVKETTFFRDREQLDAIDWRQHLADARQRGGEVVVWCAGCATGEEAYSLAMLATEAFAPAAPPVRIIATDLSETALRAARVGRYRERALWAVDETVRSRYFTVDHHTYLVGNGPRQLVTFQQHNFVTDPTPPDGARNSSVVICRNVFIYFEPEAVNRALQTFRGALAPGGALIVGAADALAVGNTFGPYERAIERAVSARSLKPNRPAPRRRTVREQPVAAPALSPDPGVVDALQAADSGNLEVARIRVEAMLTANPLDPSAHFVRGVVELSSGRPDRAVEAFRAALYVDPQFGVAAFMLGRAHDECGARSDALRAYEQSLRIFDSGDGRYEYLLAQLEVHDVAAACRLRLAAAR